MSRRLRTLSLAIALIFSFNMVVMADSSSSLQDKIENNNNKIEDLENEKDKINGEINEQNSVLEGIMNQINEKSKDLDAAKADVDSYQRKIDDFQGEIDSLNSKIDSSKNAIQDKEAIIEEKKQEEEKIQANIGTRLRSYYKIDIATTYLYLILKSGNIFELFNNLQNVFRMINYDRELINRANNIQKEMEEEKNKIAEELKSIEECKNEIVAKQDELKEAQKEYLAKQEYHQSKMNELQALENDKINILASLNDKEKELAHEIGELTVYNQALQQELESILAEINNGNSSVGSSGGSSDGDGGSSGGSIIPGDPSTETFLRPGSGIVTDEYGPRINPVTGAAGFHTGVDLGDPYGAPVAASKSGTVVYSGWFSDYGQTVIIDHGGGVQTLYAHNSALLVSVGQTVARGETIAQVGSTGMSTGPHIHWEIRINGQHISPMPYV